ncbi:hypothetical protein DERF_012048 [Dermatophagoides farinae]|uniref:Uncharacterized protein n=1 Tax=Dermatophagoides farinae TaxID=6954 RepID=A0A922HR71_DERFA|nr:hypothetical protein DERF_012048 [Dermatophagoides farinae]
MKFFWPHFISSLLTLFIQFYKLIKILMLQASIFSISIPLVVEMVAEILQLITRLIDENGRNEKNKTQKQQQQTTNKKQLRSIYSSFV